jgi:hypothetical protein
MKRSPLVPIFAAATLSALAPASAQTPPAVNAAATFGQFRVVPSPAVQSVASVFARNRARFAACDPTGIPGTVSLRMATDANGQVSSATVRASSFAAPNTRITGCVVEQARHLRFISSTQGTLGIELVVTLGPPADAGAPAAH